MGQKEDAERCGGEADDIELGRLLKGYEDAIRVQSNSWP